MPAFASFWLPSLCALVSCVAGQPPAGPWDAALHLLPQTQIGRFNARCLDGSAPGFYYRPGADTTKWKIHIQGGGFCTNLADCYARSQTVLGSSATWTPWLSSFWLPRGAGFYGIMDANTTNPFGAWNFVWLAYCDGSSQTSDVAQPLPFNGTLLHLRGRAVLDAQLAELEAMHGFLSTATEVIVSGTSAGGLGAYLHAGHIKSRLAAAGARCVALPDAGFLLDHAAYASGQHVWYAVMEAGWELWNGTLRGGGGRCLADFAPRGLGARCIFPQYLYPYLHDVDGVFVLQSLYDSIQLGDCFQLRCALNSTCNATQAAAIQGYSRDLLAEISAAQALFAHRDAAFLTSCFQHEESCRARDWYGIIIGGQSANSTFYNWYVNGVGPDAARVDLPWPGDGTCAPQGVDHGVC